MNIKNKRLVSCIQGSPEWHQHRATAFNASEAAAMLGVSSYVTRSELLRQKATGDVPEVDEATQRRFDKGHEYEAIARPWAEEIIGDTLYPVVLAADVDDLPLSASLDGLTMLENVAFEHKTLNEKLAAALDAGTIPDEYKPQMEQALLISGADKCLFMASDGNRDTMRHAWYESDTAVRAKVLAGWAQFNTDLANYVHVEPAPKAVAAPVLDLPAVSVQVTGSITIADNFKAFETALTDFIGNRLIREPKTDQDFADLDSQIKTLKKAEDALQKAEAAVVAQVASIDTMKRTKDMLYKLTRDNRLMAEKLLESEKTRRRVEIQEGGKKALADHISALNTRLGKPYMPAIAADFVGVTKGKRTIITLQDAVDTELARAKIAANEIADRIDLNLKALREASSYNFLFHDASQLVLKANDDLQNVIKARIAEHKEAEDKRLEAEQARIRAEEERKAAEKLEQERQRIRQEEETKAKAEQERIAAQNGERVTMGSTAEPIQQPQPAQNIHIPDTASAKVDNGALAAGELIYTARSIAPGRVAVVMGNTEYRMSAEDAERLRSALGAAVLTARAAA